MNPEASVQPSITWEEQTSRSGVLKLPHFMAMLTYISKTYGLPRYGWLNPKIRYHYTDASGLLGIVTSHRLWATDIRFLNDRSEGKFLPEKILALMRSKADSGSDRTRGVINGINKGLLNPREISSTFSVSFCADGDLLSQWRGYGSFGAGYAIGMDLQRTWHTQLGLFYDVSYGDEGLDAVAADFLDIYVHASEKWGEYVCDEAAAVLRALASSFKDLAYKEEQESRIVYGYTKASNRDFLNEAPLRFRTQGCNVVPYISLASGFVLNEAVPKLPIKQIIVGPGVDYERNRHSISQLLDENGYEGVEIVPSVVPFRP